MRDPDRSRRRLRRALVVALACVVFGGGLEAVWHRHVPHAEVREGTAVRAQDEGDVGTCAICRLAHQTSSVAIEAQAAGLPGERTTSVFPVPASHTAAGVHRSFSPRAPPLPAAC